MGFFHKTALLTALAAFCLSLAAAPSVADAKPKTHTVYKGQRLGSIAKRYNVSVDELCQANGINRRDPIQPGQKLVIPGTEDDSSKKSDAGSKKSDSKGTPGKPGFHTVAKGHTLSAIAGRYAVTVSALCHANGIPRNKTLEVGERIVIPAKPDKDGSYARSLRLAGKLDREDEDHSGGDKSTKNRKTWQPYVKPAWRAGYIKIRRYGRSWEGYVIGPKNQVLGHASNKINYVLGATEDGPRIDERLIRLIAHVSDKFGGRELRIVSGYRTKSFVAASKHKAGRALDFSIPGMPNDALRDYLRTLKNVGVGYYPNSSFVHLDVRGYNAYWVDHAGPGQAPQIRKAASRKTASRKTTPRKSQTSSSQKVKSKDSESAQAEGSSESDSKNAKTSPDEKKSNPAPPARKSASNSDSENQAGARE